MRGPNWQDELPLVLLGIRTAWREDPGCSPANLVYGTDVQLPGEFLADSSREFRATSAFTQHLLETVKQFWPPETTVQPKNLWVCF